MMILFFSCLYVYFSMCIYIAFVIWKKNVSGNITVRYLLDPNFIIFNIKNEVPQKYTLHHMVCMWGQNRLMNKNPGFWPSSAFLLAIWPGVNCVTSWVSVSLEQELANISRKDRNSMCCILLIGNRVYIPGSAVRRISVATPLPSKLGSSIDDA